MVPCAGDAGGRARVPTPCAAWCGDPRTVTPLDAEIPVRVLRSVILASGSPRRRRLLRSLGVRCQVITPCIQESRTHGGAPAALVRRNALAKARAVAATQRDGIVIGADTIVWCRGRVIGKPATWRRAQAQLRQLSGQTHWVHTGVALVHAKTGQTLVAATRARVLFRTLSPACQTRYLRCSHPLDKAGAYAIQRDGAVIVDRIDGCLSTVVGLPVPALERLLRRWSWRLP